MELDTYHRLMQQVFEPARLHHVVRTAIEVAADESGQVQQIEPVLKSHPAWRERLVMMPLLKDRVTAWATEVNEKEPNFAHPIVLTRTLRLLGKRPTRDALAGLWLKQVAGGEGNEQPSYALKAEEDVQDRSWPYPHNAYQAGLHYDWLRSLLNGKKASPDAKSAVEDAWKSAQVIARTSHVLGALVKNFKLARYSYGAGLLVPWGAALMSFVFPKACPTPWAGFVAEVEKLGEWRWAYQTIREPKKFDVTSAELGSLAANFFGSFREIDPALRFVATPYSLREASPDQYRLSQILRFSQMTAGKKMDHVKFGPTEAQGLKDLAITPKQLWEAVGSISK